MYMMRASVLKEDNHQNLPSFSRKTITKICPLFQFAKQNILQESGRTKKRIKKY